MARGRRNNSREKLLPTTIYDLEVRSTGGTTNVPFSVVDADSVFDSNDWTYSVVVSNWDESKSATLAAAPDVSAFETLVKSVSNKALTDNVATLTTTTAHGLVVGDRVTITGVNSTFNGTYTVTAIPTTTTFRYAKTATNVASSAVSPVGTAVRDDSVIIEAAYQETLNVLGLRDPGTFTMYATRPTPGNPTVDEIVELYQGNASIKLAEQVTPIYSP
jgi:hypothetical protein